MQAADSGHGRCVDLSHADAFEALSRWRSRCAGDAPSAGEDLTLLSDPRSRLGELWRVVGIAVEFIQGFRALHFVGPCVTVFGSARCTEAHPAYEIGRALGRRIAASGFTVMTGGGPGLMEAANRGAREAGGRSVGCNIQLPAEQQPNAYLDSWTASRQCFVRKVLLFKYSYAFVALPGGLGRWSTFSRTWSSRRREKP